MSIIRKIITGLIALWAVIFSVPITQKQAIEKQPMAEQQTIIQTRQEQKIEEPIGGVIEPEKITILNKQYTQAEYATLKTDVISKMAKRKTVLPQLDDFQKWIEIANKECPKMVLTDITEVNLVDRINSYIQNGCK